MNNLIMGIVVSAIEWQEHGSDDPEYYMEKLFKNVMLFKAAKELQKNKLNLRVVSSEQTKEGEK